ncbi:MAG: ABC transporter ATP-binding protein, partial [Spirochaetales bacterium]|nr:ABC transporter ATP-binding protein [Spirochaetales bacterium]
MPQMNRKPKVDLGSNIRKIVGSMKPYYVQILVSFACVAISVVISIIAPQWLSKFTNEVTRGAATRSIDLGLVAHYATVLIVFYGTNAILSYISGFIMNTVTQKYSKGLRTQLSNKINRMKLKYFDSHAYGDTLSIITNDVDQIGQSTQQAVTMMFHSVMMLIGVLVAMFYTKWQLALTVLASIPLVMMVLMFVMRLAMPQFHKRQKQVGELNGIIEETFSGHLVVKAFNAEAEKGRVFDESNERLHWTMFKAQALGGNMQPLMSLISYISYAGVCLVGGLLLANGKAGMTFGTITAFMVYVNLFQNPLSQVAQAMNSLQMAAASADRVFTFLEEEEQEDESSKPSLLDPAHIRGEVEFRNVRFGYDPDKTIIPDFSAKVEPGMKVAIVGPTG